MLATLIIVSCDGVDTGNTGDTGDTGDICSHENFPNHNKGDCWSDKAPDNMNHAETISYCENLGGHLPTISELRTLIRNCPKTEYPKPDGQVDWCEIEDLDYLGGNYCSGIVNIYANFFLTVVNIYANI